MDEVIQVAQRALSHFHHDDGGGCYLSGDFHDLHSHLKWDSVIPEAVKKALPSVVG